jgi:KaiC/GvpD/RAD55 family RecA-like ATPase
MDVALRAATGIVGLDGVLAGGLPTRRLYLLQGLPGVGKTTLGLQFLIEGARLGERVLYITLSETEEEIRQGAASHPQRIGAAREGNDDEIERPGIERTRMTVVDQLTNTLSSQRAPATPIEAPPFGVGDPHTVSGPGKSKADR